MLRLSVVLHLRFNVPHVIYMTVLKLMGAIYEYQPRGSNWLADVSITY